MKKTWSGASNKYDILALPIAPSCLISSPARIMKGNRFDALIQGVLALG